jgi:hypothetical protein
MHTAKLFKPENFDVEVEGEATDLRGLFPASAQHDRFGIVVTETFGGLGASLLIQAADRERAGGMRIETYRRIDIERALGVIAGLGAG